MFAPHDVVVGASAGNFGQGLARASSKGGNQCVVFASERANQVKVEAMEALGAKVMRVGRDFDEAKDHARAYSALVNAPFVEDGAEPAIAEGAGTLALELLEASPQLDTMLVPLGNGALLADVGEVFRHDSPQSRMIGIVAENAPSMKLSLRAKKRCRNSMV